VLVRFFYWEVLKMRLFCTGRFKAEMICELGILGMLCLDVCLWDVTACLEERYPDV
jgi:hypothetical protein